MHIGIGLALTQIARAVGFNPASLFAASEVGAWYDPSDLTTLFQDSAGTTAVTAVEQPVGLMLDKSRGGRQSLATTGWVKNSGDGVVTVDGNTITITGATTTTRVDITAPGWAVGNLADITITGSVGGATGQTLFLGGGTVYTALSGTKTFRNVISASTLLRLQINTGSATFVVSSRGYVPGNHALQTTSGNRPTLSARVNQLVGTATLSTQSVTVRATQQTLTFTGAGSITLSGTATGTYTAGTYTFTPTAGSLTLTVSGTVTNADLRESNAGVGLPAYQAVVTSTNYTSTGFPLYLRFNGTSSAMATGSINFTGTDKMTVWAGVRKNSDAAAAMLTELSATASSNAGSFYVSAPESAGNYGFRARGATGTGGYNPSTYSAPITNVLSAELNLAAASVASAVIPQVNGSLNQTNIANVLPGGGNFGNYPLYVGARAGTSVFFNGQLYSLIVRGAASSATQITQTEGFVNGKTKAYA